MGKKKALNAERFKGECQRGNGSDKVNCKEEDTANEKVFLKRSVVLGIISTTKIYTVEDL